MGRKKRCGGSKALEKRGAEVAKHFGIKPEKKKRVKKEEPKEEAGE